jgi:hypothetical protein
MLKCLGGGVEHFETIHDAPRAGVAGRRHGGHFAEAQPLEGVLDDFRAQAHEPSEVIALPKG